MTFGATLRGTISRTRLLLKRQIWIWPIVAIVVLGAVGWGLGRLIHDTMEDNLRSELTTLLTVERAMLEKWLEVQESTAQTLADQGENRRAITELLAAEEGQAGGAGPGNGGAVAPAAAALRAQLTKSLEPAMSAHGFVGFVVADRQRRIIACDSAGLIGETPAEYEAFMSRALLGQATVSPPFPSLAMLKDSQGRLRSGTPTMFVCAPVRDAELHIVAVLGLRIRPEHEFTRILQLGQIGTTGETYAANREGVMVSNSRFDESLILSGLLPDTDSAASILSVQLRDPGGDTTQGFRPGVRRKELPLTVAVASAVKGESQVNTEGYRNYRGVAAVGAWTWLAAYDLAIITEIDQAEAYRPLLILQRTFFGLFALLGLAAAAIFVFTLVVARAHRRAQQAVIQARQLGQYRLLEKIGEGAMGVVYKGQHAMLRRPTAIKMLAVDRVNEAAAERFEREVQITCSLNSPYTVAIYDYGRTPEGVFYYAMEYLDGIDLQALVDRDGPQPEGRVVSILRQVCASLYEAHSLGLVHRDIKPANVMLNRRGGEPDVVKVLDFGLVKAARSAGDGRTSGGELTGTPLYMSPEAIHTPDSVDACSDLYAVGAVGYFLLTGQAMFSARTLSELCQQHLTAIPEPPSARLGRPISAELEHAILACLEKNRAKRPQTARDLAAMLARAAGAWTSEDAEAWWSRHERQRHTAAGSEPGGGSVDRDAPAERGRSEPPSGPTSALRDRAARTSAQGFDQTTCFEPADDPDH
jgi:serine/threonine protein kinase